MLSAIAWLINTDHVRYVFSKSNYCTAALTCFVFAFSIIGIRVRYELYIGPRAVIVGAETPLSPPPPPAAAAAALLVMF